MDENNGCKKKRLKNNGNVQNFNQLYTVRRDYCQRCRKIFTTN